MNERIEELEARYSFQEDLLQQLNEIVTAQQKQLDLQAKQLHLLHQQLQELQEFRDGQLSPGSDLTQEKPPHY